MYLRPMKLARVSAAFIALITIGAADERPVWVQFDKLICPATATTFCKDSGCEKVTSSAVFIIDFKGGTVKALSSKEPITIVSRYYIPPLGKMGFAKSSIVTAEHDVFNFQPTTENDFGSATISGVRVMAYDDQVVTMWLSCHPA
jgi:hypothetical protein